MGVISRESATPNPYPQNTVSMPNPNPNRVQGRRGGQGGRPSSRGYSRNNGFPQPPEQNNTSFTSRTEFESISRTVQEHVQDPRQQVPRTQVPITQVPISQVQRTQVPTTRIEQNRRPMSAQSPGYRTQLGNQSMI